MNELSARFNLQLDWGGDLDDEDFAEDLDGVQLMSTAFDRLREHNYTLWSVDAGRDGFTPATSATAGIHTKIPHTVRVNISHRVSPAPLSAPAHGSTNDSASARNARIENTTEARERNASRSNAESAALNESASHPAPNATNAPNDAATATEMASVLRSERSAAA